MENGTKLVPFSFYKKRSRKNASKKESPPCKSLKKNRGRTERARGDSAEADCIWTESPEKEIAKAAIGRPIEGGSAPEAAVAFPISRKEDKSAKAVGGKSSFGREQSAEKKRTEPVTESRVSEAL